MSPAIRACVQKLRGLGVAGACARESETLMTRKRVTSLEVMRWLTLLATAAVALAEVEIITSPTPGNEYVKISAEPKVLIEDDGQTGYQHKFHSIKKAELISSKKDTLGLKATVKDEGLTGVVKKTAGNGVPPLKHMDDASDDKRSSGKFDVVAPSSWKSKRDEGGLDFDDDLPLSDKKLKPAGTSQASRINVKKGPNGQDYEYEYVYYYYDEDEDEPGPSAQAPANQINQRNQYTEIKRPSATTTRLPSTDFEDPRNRGELVKQKNVDSGSEPTINHGRIPVAEEGLAHHRGGHRVVEVSENVDEEVPRRKAEHRQDNRYSTIDRGTSSSRGRGEPVAVTTIEPSSNEVLPSRGSQRSRGRHVDLSTAQQIQEVDDRLPTNTRFPSRGRGSSVGTTIPPSQPTSPSRTRGQSGNGATIRRPSLVDSSSFRTHSSDSAPDADLDKNYYRSSPPLDTRESDLEEYIQPEQVRPTTFVPPQTTTPQPPAPLPEQRDGSMPDKAALDLYAIIQQQQEENSVSGTGGDIQGTVPANDQESLAPEPTTLPPTTITTTTTTTTTEAPTTTTTTTTAAPPLAGRGRFKQGPGSRTRLRLGGAGSTTTTTSTEAPHNEDESAAPKRKFAPSHGGRNPGQPSAYSRRGIGARSSTTTAAPAQEQEASTARARASFGSNRNQFRARGRTTPAAHAEEETASETTTASSSTARPTRPRLNVNPATRPLRPRVNLRTRAGLSTPAPAAPQAANAEENSLPAQSASQPSSTLPPTAAPPAEEEASPAPVAPTDALSRLRNRPRLKVTPRQPGAVTATSAPAQRQLPQGFKRPGRPLAQQQQSSPAEEAAPAPTEPAAAQTEAPAQVDQPAPTEPPVPPHLARRRPAIRRLQIPSQHNQQQ
ncbi:Hypothetical protein NTJ_12749 [Nesidiocoris tenuis]|uniref:Uncharacterized protein n=1 Tax=Nesidiocoris tenuis TaxID=355587 RepID=A0ABN7B8F0_9HEMI|nr:Hypothetical protein NTJ_12749 [Nesidiocoris tenuis]